MQSQGPKLIWAVVALAVLFVGVMVLTQNSNPNAIGNMPGPVQEVLDTPTLSGNDIADNILTVTGNESYIGQDIMPGDYSYGPADDQGNNTYYVNFNVPVNLAGIAKQLGYHPAIYTSDISSGNETDTTTTAYDDYVSILPLPNEAFDRLYFDPNTHMAEFSFKLNADGTVMDESWDAVAVNS
jgi:hypothetical protein